MVKDELKKLADLLHEHREELMQCWRAKVHQVPATRGLDIRTLDDHIAAVLDNLSAALERGDPRSVVRLPLDQSAQIHGVQRLREGFNLIEVVAEYNLLRETLLELAERNGIRVVGQVSSSINRVFDKAIGLAVQTYSEQKT